MKEINLNKKGAYININELNQGRNLIKVKLGRKWFVIDVNKNAIDSNVSIYSFQLDKNNNLIKHNNVYFKSCNLKNTVLINRYFLENFWEKLAFINDNIDLLRYIG